MALAVQTRKRRPRGELRARQIAEAARAVFAARGYEAASIAEIAARVGIVEGALYRHFESKRELLNEVLRAFYRPVIDRLREGLRGVEGTRNRLRFLIWSHLCAFRDEPDMVRLVIREVRPGPDYAHSMIRDLNRELTRHALDVIQEGIDAGEIEPAVRPALLRDLIYGGLEHIAWDAVVGGRGSLDVDGLADNLTDVVWRGIAARERDHATDAGARLEGQLDRLERLLHGAPARRTRS